MRYALPVLTSLFLLLSPAVASAGDFDAPAAIETAQASDGNPYTWGQEDCSGYLSEVFNAGTGEGVRFTTDSDFGAMGWEPGYDPNGLSISTNGGSGENGHMTGELYGVPIESDGSNGVQYGGTADGAQTYPEQWHWPAASDTTVVPEVIAPVLPGVIEGGNTYVVQPGDTLSTITPDWANVAALNGIDNPDLIYPGQELQL